MKEVIQRVFSGRISGMGGLPNEERLGRLGLYVLEHKRVNGDFLEILTGWKWRGCFLL